MRSVFLLAALPLALSACQQSPESSDEVPAAVETLPAEPDGGIGTTPADPPSETSTAAGEASAKTIPPALQGRWGMVPADCTSTRGDAKGLLTITDTTLKFYESVGKLGSLESRSDNAIRAQFAFTGEGMNWTRDVELSAAGDKLIRTERGGDQPGGPFTYTRCAA
ncbi:hypothetical protein GCM10011515_05140 [Tsuneonella deserti]|uniref:Protease inhibitor Inh n=1 Tax=Tsuneonella deserti TaxID=2035528 RepID=A0ABQ1S2C6_9SPHN|nr:hypothetical protein [Tsuneonella deserti]GGD88433.1 hypothetical protein GCM10011515_05140 [Tsuneonella deserti]